MASSREALAVRIAAGLSAAHHELAADRSSALLVAAHRGGDVGRIDLLRAVVALLEDASGAFQRSRQ